MNRLLAMIAGLALATSAAAAGGDDTGKLNTNGADLGYGAYATGGALKEIKFFHLYNWRRNSDQSVVIWTRPSEAYILDLAHDCDELRSGRVVIELGGVAGVPGRLRLNDDLLVGRTRCRVTGIQAMDLVAMNKANGGKKKD